MNTLCVGQATIVITFVDSLTCIWHRRHTVDISYAKT